MTMTNQEKAAAERAKEAECRKRREESWERSDTDGFLTQWANGICAQEHRLQAEIYENDGKSEFVGLFERATGERIAAKLIEGKYGLCWAFCDEDGNFTGRFIGHSQGTKRSKIWKEGFELRQELAPAKATVKGQGTGLSGTAWACVVRTDGGFPPGAKVVD